MAQIKRQAYAVDAEEFVDGLVCVALPVWLLAPEVVPVAVQAPAVRTPLQHLLLQVPRLKEAAQALGRTLA